MLEFACFKRGNQHLVFGVKQSPDFVWTQLKSWKQLVLFIFNFGREDVLLDVWWSTHFFACFGYQAAILTLAVNWTTYLEPKRPSFWVYKTLFSRVRPPKQRIKLVPGIYHGTSTIFDGSVKTFCNLSGEGSWFLKSGYDSFTLR